MNKIVLTTINAKWIHPSLALRLLKANLGALEEKCEIIELNLRQPFSEKLEKLLAAHTRVLGISVSIWNHTATLELLAELEKAWAGQRPIVVIGGPEVSYLPESSRIFHHADYVIRGEGEIAFAALCENIITRLPLADAGTRQDTPKFINAENVNLNEIKSAYHLYTDEDLSRKLVYVESSRGCPFNCEFCLSSSSVDQLRVLSGGSFSSFFEQMDDLVNRGAKTFKFLDRTFNININRAIQICEFFLKKIAQGHKLVVHFEMVPSLFAPELVQTLSRFPPGTLRLEIGIQTLNAEVSARIGRPSNPAKELAALSQLRKQTSAIIHADLIAGLPGEDLKSFGEGFDRLWQTLQSAKGSGGVEIQLGILKLLPGAPIARHSEAFAMRYNPAPPYEVLETSVMSARDLERIKNFARFWELIVNRGLVKFTWKDAVFERFMKISELFMAKFGQNWGIDKSKLMESIEKFMVL